MFDRIFLMTYLIEYFMGWALVFILWKSQPPMRPVSAYMPGCDDRWRISGGDFLYAISNTVHDFKIARSIYIDQGSNYLNEYFLYALYLLCAT